MTFGVGAGIVGIATSFAFADTRSPCEGHVVRQSTVLPLGIAGVIVVACLAPYLVVRNRDVYGERKPFRRQLGRVALAIVIAVLVVAVGFLILAARASQNCYS